VRCGTGCKPFLYVCYVCHFTTYGVLVTTLHGSFIAVFSATSVQCSCLFPNMKVNVSQRVRYRSYSPWVSVCNTFPKHKPRNECFKSLFLKRNRKKGELDCGVYSEELYLLQRKIYKITSLKFKRQYLFDPLINVVWRQPRTLKTGGSYPFNRHPMKKLQVFAQF